MTSKRLSLILTACVVLAVIALVGGAYGINSMLSKKAGTLSSLKAKSKALEQEQNDLKVAKQSLEQYAELEQIAKAVVPEDKNQAEAVRQIANIAAANGISLASITFPASNLGAGISNTASPSGSASTAAPQPSAAAGSKTSQLEAVKNIPGVYELPITVTSDNKHPVPYGQFINFLNALEHNRRTAQVSSITLQPNNLNRNNLSFILVLNEYIKP